MSDDIVNELKKMNLLLIHIMMKDYSQPEKILFLDKSDYSPKEISGIIGTTSNTVSVTLSRTKKAKK